MSSSTGVPDLVPVHCSQGALCTFFSQLCIRWYYVGRKKSHHHGRNYIIKMQFLQTGPFFTGNRVNICQDTNALWYVLRETKRVWRVVLYNGWRYYVTLYHFRIPFFRNTSLKHENSLDCWKLSLHTSL